MMNVLETINALEAGDVASPLDLVSSVEDVVSFAVPAAGQAIAKEDAILPMADGTGGRWLLCNGNFEAGFAHWVTLEGTERISQTDGGRAALVLSTVDSGTTQNVRVAPGRIYRLMGYGYSTSQEYSSFGMTFFNAKGSFLARTDVGRIDAVKWHDYFAGAIAPAQSAYVQIWTYQSFNHGHTYIDGLTFQQITPDDIPPRALKRFTLVNQPLDPMDNTFSFSPSEMAIGNHIGPKVYQSGQECQDNVGHIG
ncbi:hypothetical protein [Leptothoe sp. PORK10 BA2]|uniref:hypothetical protein n=1 Tax=Leptothoe sp. PORK10 BA2 TaxID=3110254 RepID=UPI002B1EFD4C|nr:hypothetical protein [Leptothoe sp. PORK10 BA2]MEA5463169.1 hypothetical protein [Leptothoe sp. PORK10 BA2]